MNIVRESKPSVSVITGFLNAEKFIQETIEGVLAQSYHDWELLLVDDGSTDGSSEIARSYARQYPDKIFYLEHDGHQNLGVCVSRNLGVRKARGEFLAILDADDVWLQRKLEEQVAILRSHPTAAMVYGAPQYWHSWTGNPEDLRQDNFPGVPTKPNTLCQPPELALRTYPLGEGPAPCPSDLMLRRDVVERLGGFEEQFRGMYQLYEDQAFLAKIYLTSPVFVSDAYWIKYRVHPESCVSWVNEAGHYHTVRRYFLEWLGKYLTEHRINDADVVSAFQKAILPYSQ